YLLTIAGLLFARYAYTHTGKTFMPTMDEGSIILQTTNLPSISLKQSIDGDLLVQHHLMKQVPEVLNVISRVGSDELGLDPMGPNETDAFLVLKPKDQWRVQDKEWLLGELRKAMNELPGFEYALTQPIEMRTSEMLTGARGDLAVKIFGPDLKILARLAGDIQKAVARVKGASEVLTVSNDTVDYLQIKIDRLMAGRMGLSVSRIEDELRMMLEGTPAGLIEEAGRRTQIIIRGDEQMRKNPDLFAQAQLAGGDGGLVRVSEIAQLQRTAGAVKIDRENASRFAIVQAFVSGRDLVGFVEDAQKVVAEQVKIPPGYRIYWGGEFENQRRAMTRLSFVVPIALGLIFAVLFVTLRSVRQSMLILSNVPFALVGGLIALWLSGEYLSVPASVGFIALLGMAVLNSLVLVSHFNHLLAAGVPVEVAVFEGALRRLRPVLMTASITAFGLMPLLFASGPGSEIQKPLAIVVIGGLMTSTLLTLILLPILFKKFGIRRADLNTQKATATKTGGSQWINPYAS
ncbi:MAG: efflux RND transporter permease subunit, partial [Hyphomicrobiaceae bacterium]|nr:efflux RND transporter permease subunit [Hyphomicrobiaceae bacterium]